MLKPTMCFGIYDQIVHISSPHSSIFINVNVRLIIHSNTLYIYLFIVLSINAITAFLNSSSGVSYEQTGSA